MKKACAIPFLVFGLCFGPTFSWMPCGLGQVRAEALTQPEPPQATSNDGAEGVVEQNFSPLEAPTDVWERIRRGYAMPTCTSSLVDKWLKYYAQDHPDYLNRMFNRSGRYLYQVIEDVEARGLPTELALLPFVESAFQPEALSKAKASGLWQFMPATGKTYDLDQNRWRDERQDILASTRAALDYFEYLYGLFNDWHLSLAAYNWGEGSVQRAMKRQQARGKPSDYLHLKMPNETANYVPKLEAIKRIVSEPQKYGVELPDVGNEPYFVTITKPRDIDTGIAAELADMEVDEFRALNPSFKLPVIVAAHDTMMHLPADKVDLFIDNLASWMDSGQRLSRWTTYVMGEGETLSSVAKQTGMTEAQLREINAIPSGRRVLPNSILLVRANPEQQEDITIAAADAHLRLSPQTTWRRVTYRVRRGDTLPRIASRWRITTQSIVKTNRLRSSRLRAGQRLILTVPNVERTPIQTASSSSASSSTEGAQGGSTSSGIRLHSVRRGESLSSIASKYGLSLAELRKANPRASSRLQVGQRLRIPSNGETVQAPQYYVVKRGDTLTQVANQTGVSITQLQRANRLSNANLRVGQRLEIPSGKTAGVTSTPSEPQKGENAGVYTGRYKVRSGDSLYSIAKRYGVSVEELRLANGMTSGQHLYAGQSLSVPETQTKSAPTEKKVTSSRVVASSNQSYVVRSGDTLAGIAKRQNTSISELKRLNNLRSSRLRVGQKLQLP